MPASDFILHVSPLYLFILVKTNNLMKSHSIISFLTTQFTAFNTFVPYLKEKGEFFHQFVLHAFGVAACDSDRWVQLS